MKPKPHAKPVPPSPLAALRESVATQPVAEPVDPESPRGRILAAARVLFSEYGFGGASTRAIAEASQVNLAMIHYYFGNKEQLYERVLEQDVLRMFQTVVREIPPELAPEEALVTLPVRFMHFLLKDPVWVRLFRREVAEGAEHLKNVIRSLGDAGPLRASEAFMQVYREAVRAKRVRNLPPEAVRECLIAIGHGGVFFASLLPVFSGRDLNDEKVLAEWTRTMTTIMRQGLLVEKS